MSKQIDTSKIDRIRNAAVRLVGEYGVSGCSVAAIAKTAGVSMGYLYRHYRSKEELIDDLFGQAFGKINEQISSQIAERHDLSRIVEGGVRAILETAANDPVRVKFLIVLMHDFSVQFSESVLERIAALAEELIEIARRTPGVRADVRKEDLYFAMIGVPMQYLTIDYNRMISDNRTGASDVDHIVAQSLALLFDK